MKILHIVPTYLPAYRYGGPIISVHELNKWLVKNGVEVTVYTTNIDGPNDLPVKVDIIDGVKIHYFKCSFPRSWFYSMDMSNALQSNIQHFNIVHITSAFLSASYLGAKYANKAGIPYIISPRGSLIPELINKKSMLLKKFYIRFIEKNNLMDAEAIHFTTTYEEDMYKELELPLRKSIVIPNGIEIRPPKSENGALERSDLAKLGFKKKFSIPENSKIILSLGRLNWKKGFDTLIPAFAEVAKQEPNVVLLIAGDDSEGYRSEIEKMIESANLRTSQVLGTCDVKNIGLANIIFTGDLRGEEKSAAYAVADMFVMPSYSENFGISAVEAMSFGLPVIVTDTVGIAPDIKEAKAGIVVKKDTAQLTKAILGLLRDYNLCTAVGELGKKLVREKYEWREIAKTWIEEYRKIVTCK